MKILIDTITGDKLLVRKEEDYHTKWGVIPKTELDKKNPRSKLGREFWCFPSRFSDLYRRLKRKAQLTALEILGRITIETGINKESVIVDAGTGSGAAACHFAHLVKKVYTFDNNPEHLVIGKENAQFLGLQNIAFAQRDVCTQGFGKIKKESIDLVFIDLPEPQHTILHAAAVLKPGGFLVIFCPQITQIIGFKEELDKLNAKEMLFVDFKTIEIIERLWKIEKDIARPAFTSLGHNGFAAVMRKV